VTIVNYIRSGSRDDKPSALLHQVLSMSPKNVQNRYQGLDSLYLQVLQKATIVSSERVRDAAASVVLAQEPLSWSALSELTDLPEATLRSLSSLILEIGGRIRSFHASFADFIIDKERCKDPAYLVDAAHHHQRLAHRCLILMNTYLVYNICALSEPGIPNSQVPDLERVLQDVVRAELRYACTHWAVHLSHVTSPNADLLRELATFCKEHLLHWFEIMSLLHLLSEADEKLATALKWCKVCVIYRHIFGITEADQMTGACKDRV
jgi:hypothetical protein